MITTRARGLANLHAATATLAVGVFFWVYAEFILRYVPVVRLTREVNLLPYFLCVVGGMMLTARDVGRLIGRAQAFELGGAAAVAARQVGFMAALIFTMMFATQDRSISRLFLGTFLLGSGILLAVLNTWLPRLLSRLVFQRGHRMPTLFVGRLAALDTLREWIAAKEALGIHPVGVLSTDEPGPETAGLPAPVLGRPDELPRLLGERAIGQVVLLELPASDAEARGVIETCREHGCRLLLHDNLAERYTHPLVPIEEEGRHFYTLQDEPLEDPLNRLLKRAFDVAVSLPVVVLILPLLSLWVWIMQRTQSPGPLFHVRERRGWQGGKFRMLKFRSMHVAEADDAAEARQASAGDVRVFPFGRYLRRRSLDEFPQFWNVLCGDMSVVGPRPYMPRLDEAFRLQAPGYRTRYFVKPGITGLAQSLGYRGEVRAEEMLRRRLYWDVYYITHWSVWMDLQITLRTLKHLFQPPTTAY